jgi:hypothetical protein
VVAMLVAAVIAPGSKLATARGLRTETATSSLGPFSAPIERRARSLGDRSAHGWLW